MYNVHVIIKYNIYSGCFVHNHIGMNKFLRKIVFTDMAIRGMPERLINNTWLAVCTKKKLGRNISGLAIGVKRNPGRNITWLAVKGLMCLSQYPLGRYLVG